MCSLGMGVSTVWVLKFLDVNLVELRIFMKLLVHLLCINNILSC